MSRFRLFHPEPKQFLPGVEINNDTTKWGDNAAYVSYEEISTTGTTPDSSDASNDKNTTANLEIDIPSYSEAKNLAPGGYTGKVFNMDYYGQTVNLGKIDLTQYSKVIISYGAYSDATFDGKDYVALASAAVQTDDGSAVEM